MTPEHQHPSGIPCLAFPLHEHVYSKFVSRATNRLGRTVLIFKCHEPFCGATDTTEGDN